jgi:hypothetical protein
MENTDDFDQKKIDDFGQLVTKQMDNIGWIDKKTVTRKLGRWEPAADFWLDSFTWEGGAIHGWGILTWKEGAPLAIFCDRLIKYFKREDTTKIISMICKTLGMETAASISENITRIIYIDDFCNILRKVTPAGNVVIRFSDFIKYLQVFNFLGSEHKTSFCSHRRKFYDLPSSKEALDKLATEEHIQWLIRPSSDGNFAFSYLWVDSENKKYLSHCKIIKTSCGKLEFENSPGKFDTLDSLIDFHLKRLNINK